MTDWVLPTSSVTYMVAAVGYFKSRRVLSDARAINLWMTTRSGKSYKQPRMEEMQGMLKLLVEDRRRREEEVAGERLRREAEFATERTRMEAERKRRELETGQQMEELRGHLESLMKVVADSRRKSQAGVECEIGAANRKG